MAAPERAPGASGGTGAAGLAAAVLDAEAARQVAVAEADREVLFADDLLPGVGGERLSLVEGIRAGGLFTFVVLVLLQSLDELEGATLQVLAPDIRDTFGVSDGVIVFISAASGAFLVLGRSRWGSWPTATGAVRSSARRRRCSRRWWSCAAWR